MKDSARIRSRGQIALDLWFIIFDFSCLRPEFSLHQKEDIFCCDTGVLVHSSSTLLACALTCRDVYSIILPYLYRNIYLCRASAYQSILCTLKLYPERARFIRNLYIKVDSDPRKRRDERDYSFQWPYYLVPIQLSGFPLDNLHFLALIGSSPPHTPSPFGVDTHAISLMAWSRFSSIKTLWIMNLKFPSYKCLSHFILSFKGLVELCLDRFHVISPLSPSASIAMTKHRRFHTLQVRIPHQPLQWDCCSFREQIQTMLKWLFDSRIANKVQHMSFAGDVFGQDWPTVPRLCNLRSLLSLVVTNSRSFTNASLLDLSASNRLALLSIANVDLEGINSILSTVASKSLEDLTIGIAIRVEANERTVHRELDQTLKKTLSSPPLSHLQEVLTDNFPVYSDYPLESYPVLRRFLADGLR